MAKKIVKPAKKATKPAPKKTAAKPAKKVASKSAPKKVVKPAPKKASKPAPKAPAKKVVVKNTAPKPAPKKVSKVPAKKAVKATKSVEKVAAKPAKEISKSKKVGKPIDAIAKKPSKKASKPAKSSKKAKKGDDDEDDDIEPEEEDDSDVDVKDEYDKPEDDDDDVVLDGDLDGPPVLDLEGGGIPLDDDDDDEIPEKRGRGRRKKTVGRAAGSESYIRNRPLHIDITKPLIKKPQAAQPEPFLNTKDDRSRYSDKELLEFKELIIDKLKEAQTDYDLLKQTLSNADNHGTDDTSPSFKLLEDGSDVLSKEETAQLAIRQEKYIVNLKNALMRIENKTYGICRVSGKLIPKERLRSVPHATLGIDAKLNQSS